MSGSTPGKTRPKRRRALIFQLALVPLLGTAFAVPIVMLDVGTQKARACFASYAGPRDAELPDCRREIRWFVMPSRVPWTAAPARYRAEEIGARVAIAAYTDALVGRPDRASLKRAAEGIEASEKVIRAGSQRLALEELGTAIGAPNLGRQAELSGDRIALLSRFDHWTEWDVQLRALEAALTDGDIELGAKIAQRYAAFDPHDEELRGAVAAMLCLGADTHKGIEFFFTIENNRALQRHESWSRNWGEVRAALVACAARAGVTPPPRPEHVEAGQGDAEEVRAALRLRLMLPPSKPAEGDPSAARDAAIATTELLQLPRTPGARVKLLAALLAGKHELAPWEIAEIAAPKKDTEEAPILPSPAGLTALGWLPYHRALSPVVEGSVLRKATVTLRSLATADKVTAEGATALLTAAAASAIEAARTFAAAGDAASAVAALDDAGERALPDAVTRALVRSSAYYLAGDRERALGELDRVAADLHAPADPASPAKPGSPEARASSLVAAALIQRAELLGSLGRREDAAKAAAIAEAAARVDRGLFVRARWTRLALTAVGSPPEPPPTAGGADAGPELRAPDDRAWPWVGLEGTPSSWLSPEAEGRAPLDRALGIFREARGASPEERRAFRYAAFAHRGDLPSAKVAYLALAAELLGSGEGDREVWLDAFSAIDGHVLPLSTYAWLRGEAARLRGDTASSALWEKRYKTLAAIVTDPARAEIAGLLGL